MAVVSSLPLNVVTYICEEVRRQGHDLSSEGDGVVRVHGMVTAWQFAVARFQDEDKPPTLQDIRAFGANIESCNRQGFRTTPIYLGGSPHGSHATLIEHHLDTLVSKWKDLDPWDLYRQYETVHPFADGNGRSGKILLNWRNGTLMTPVFPPLGFWGRPIQNP